MAISTTDANSKPDDKERLPELDDDTQAGVDEPQSSPDDQVPARDDRVAKSETTEAEPAETPRDAMVRRYRELRDAKVPANDDGDDDAGDIEQQAPAAAAAATPSPASPPVKADQPPPASPNDVALEATRALLEQTRTMVEEARALRSPAPAPAPAANDDDNEGSATDKASRLAVEDDRLEEIVERIQIGDKAEGRAALTELIEIVGSKVHAGMKPDEIGRVVQSHMAQERVTDELKGAANAFRDKYKGLVADQDLLDTSFRRLDSELRSDLVKIGVPEADVRGADSNALMNMHRSARLSGKPVRAYGEIFETVGSTVQSKFAPMLAPAPAAEPHRKAPTSQPIQPVNSERVDRKRQLSAQPRAAGMRSDPQPQQKPKTRAEVVADMRRQRGFKV